LRKITTLISHDRAFGSHRRVVDHLKINCAIGTRCDRLAKRLSAPPHIVLCAVLIAREPFGSAAAMFVILAAIYPYYVVRDAALQEGSFFDGVHSVPDLGNTS
jgi:hypothetical protein